jgi:hypothetical protein
MPTLTIGDKRVTVGEEFMQLSPDQQHATVDEIAQQLGVGATAPAPIDPRERAAQVSALPVDQREQPSEAAMRSPLGNLAQTKGQSFGQGFADTGGMGFADEAGAFVGSKLTGNSYDDTLKEMRDIRAGAQEQNPGSYLGGQVAGAVAPAIAGGGGPEILTGIARPGTSLLARMGVGSAAGGIQGGVYGFGSGEDGLEDRLASGAGGAVSGAVIGGIAPAVSGAVTGTIEKLAGGFNKAAPKITADALNHEKELAYQLSEKAGVVINPRGMKTLHNRIVNDFTNHAFLPANEPGAHAVLKEIGKQANKPVTLKGLDTLRKMAGNAYIPGNKSNNALIGKVVKRIDELIDSGNGKFMSGLNTMQGVQALKKARLYAHRARKLETVEKFVNNGKAIGNSQINQDVEGATRRQVRTLLTNDAKARGFTPAELKAAEKASSMTPGMRTLRAVSGLLPQGKLGGMMQMATAAGHGFSPAGLAMQGAGMAAGYGAKKLEERLSRASVEEFVDLVSRGGIPAPVVKNAIQRLARSKRNAITRALIRTGVVLSPNQQQAETPAR